MENKSLQVDTNFAEHGKKDKKLLKNNDPLELIKFDFIPFLFDFWRMLYWITQLVCLHASKAVVEYDVDRSGVVGGLKVCRQSIYDM